MGGWDATGQCYFAKQDVAALLNTSKDFLECHGSNSVVAGYEDIKSFDCQVIVECLCACTVKI